MSEDFMKCPGLRPHGASFQLKCRIPADVAKHYASPYRILKITQRDARTAHAAGIAQVAQWAAEYQRLRESDIPPRTSISADEVERLTLKMVRSILASDEESRELGSYVEESDYRRAVEWLEADSAALREELGRGLLRESVEVAQDWLRGHGYAIPEDSPEFRKIALSFAKARAEAVKARKARLGGDWVDTPPEPLDAPEKLPAAARLMLSDVVREYLTRTTHSAPMLKKHTVTLGLLLEVIGDKPVGELKQKDIHDFLGTLCQLPPRWKDEQRSRGLSISELAALPWPKGIAPKTYEDGYVASLRPFLLDSINLFGDQGFPLSLNTNRVLYSGTRAADERQQRALSADELVRLFNGPEYREFAADPAQAHRYWLPLLGLFTGARVTELCQLNPQCDIREEGGIAFIDITDKSPADPRIIKSVKNKSSRRTVPIHSELVGLGFLRYVERVRKDGHMLLFPSFALKGTSAGAGPGIWFGKLLEATGLRDETQGAAVVGFHTFRSTFLNRAMHLDIPYAQWLTGHVDPSVSKVVREYRGTLELAKKREILERVVFDLVPLQHAHEGPAKASE